MSLVMNGTFYESSPTSLIGGATLVNPLQVFQGNTWLCIFAGEGGFTDQTSLPDANYAPVAWRLPKKGGSIASRCEICGVGVVTPNGRSVRRGSAGLTGSGDIAAIGARLVQLFADIVGSGEISAANLNAILNILADITGSGGAAGVRSALGAMLADMYGDGTLDTSILTGEGELDADIKSYGELTPQNVRDEVWNAVAGQFNNVGTMGEKLNDAGSGSNPWTEVIESGYTAAEILRILAAVAAGVTNIDEGPPVVVTFTGLDGTTTRVEAEMTDSERTTVALDGE